MNIKTQLVRLLSLEFLSAFQLAGGIWVVLLTTRGFSLIEIGLAEGFFHVISLCCELPSGMLADVLGRRRTMLLSHGFMALSILSMLVSRTLVGICISMGLTALSYNFASGTREALSYESLLQFNRETDYLSLASKQSMLWRLGQALAMLCTGGVLWMGWKTGYCLDLLGGCLCIWVTLGLKEPVSNASIVPIASLHTIPAALSHCIRESVSFLCHRPSIAILMMVNALIGSWATLTRFFLQALLLKAGVPVGILGILLLLSSLGSVLGAWLAVPLARLPYGLAAICSLVGTVAALLLCQSGIPVLMVFGGIFAGMSDDFLQVLTDSRLNHAIPSAQRATLISISSLLFSLVMALCSPLAGMLFLR